MKIIIDTREQTPFQYERFREQYHVETERGSLDSGDYSLAGFESSVAVERKELGDLIGCLSHDRERFTRELARLRGYDSPAIVVEAPFSYIQGGRYRSKMNPDAAVQSLYSIMQEYRIPIFFAPDRHTAEHFTFHFLRHFLRHIEARCKAILAQRRGETA